jgi:Kef-type K+ transport system membrane component KefB
MGVGTVGRGLLKASVGMAALVLAAFAATRWVLPRLFRWLAAMPEALFVWSLTWCFGFIVAAQSLGLSVEIGAFVAGVSLAQLPYNEELARRVHPLANFFLAVFFVTLGIHMEPAAALALWPAVLALSAFVLVAKPTVLMALLPRFGYGERTSFFAAVTLGQVSEFSFIVAALALSAGLVDAAFISLVGMLGLVTIGGSAALIGGADRLYALARRAGVLRPFRAKVVDEPPPPPGLRDHVIVVGMNTLGRRLVQVLLERGEKVLAVDANAANLEGLPCPTVQGSTEHPGVLEHAGLRDARLLVSALQIEDANNLLAWRARQAGVPSSIHAFDPDLIPDLRDNGATHLMVSKHDGIRGVAMALRDAGVMR